MQRYKPCPNIYRFHFSCCFIQLVKPIINEKRLPKETFSFTIHSISKKCRTFATAMSSLMASVGATTMWKSGTVRFVFDYLNVGNSNLFQKQCRGDAYGCVYYAQPECAEARVALRILFGCIIIYVKRGYRICSFKRDGFLRPK